MFRGVVVGVESLGSETMVDIRLDAAVDAVAEQRVTVRRFGAGSIVAGDRVHIRVLGPAVAY